MIKLSERGVPIADYCFFLSPVDSSDGSPMLDVSGRDFRLLISLLRKEYDSAFVMNVARIFNYGESGGDVLECYDVSGVNDESKKVAGRSLRPQFLNQERRKMYEGRLSKWYSNHCREMKRIV